MFTSIFQSISNIVLLPSKAVGGTFKGMIYADDDATAVTIKAVDSYETKADAVSKVAADVVVSTISVVFLIMFLLTRYVKPFRNFMIGNPIKRKAKLFAEGT